MRLPPPLNWLWSGWKAFSHALGLVMSKIILTVLWIVGFGIYAIALRIIRVFKPETVFAASYWIEVPPRDADAFQRQF